MPQEPDHFYLNQTELNKSCLLALRDIILAHHSELTACTKYGMPCFCYQGKALCYLWTDKKTNQPYILLVNGNLMQHPQLQAGSRKRMKILPINPSNDIPVNVITEVLDEALAQAKKNQ